MMRRLFFLFLLAGICFAQQQPSQSDFTDFVNDVFDGMETSGRLFVQGAAGGASTIGQMFDAFSSAGCDVGPVSTEYFYMTYFAVIIVLFAITTLYLFGHLLQMPNMIAFAKSEYFQAGILIVQLGFNMAALFAGDLFFRLMTQNVPPSDIVYGGKTLIIDAAIAFSRLMVFEISKNYSGIVFFNMVLHTLYAATMYIGTNFRSMYNFNLGTALKPFMDLAGMGLQTLSIALGEWLVHIIVLCFIKKWTWTIFIPISVFLRAFPQTRQVGVALMMLVFALSFFYPLMFILTYETHKLLSPYLVDPFTELKNMATQTGFFTNAAMILAMALLGGGAIVPVIGNIAILALYDLFKNVAYYVIIMSLVMPFFTIFITLTAAREWAKAAGVDVNYMSFLKII